MKISLFFKIYTKEAGEIVHHSQLLALILYYLAIKNESWCAHHDSKIYPTFFPCPPEIEYNSRMNTSAI